MNLHPHLGTYSQDFIAPELLAPEPRLAVKKEAPEIYSFPLFTPAFCQQIIEEVENTGVWVNEPTLDTYQPLHFLGNRKEDAHRLGRPLKKRPRLRSGRGEPDQCSPLCETPGLADMVKDVADKHIAPMISALWPEFDLKIYDHPYLLKYEAGLSKEMELHVDEEPLALICYLNEDYEGGGTSFPGFNYTTGKKPAGTALMYPGLDGHEHQGLPILSGTRYLFLMAFF